MATNPELFRPEYLTRLPLPLAQVDYRAFNAKDSRGQHDNALFVFEASVRLAVVVAILDYCSRVKRGAPHERTVDDLLARLSRPSQGHWVAMLRGLARHFGEQPMPPWNPLGLLWGQITTPRDDLPSILSLYRRVKNGPDGRPAGDRNCSLVQLFEALASYRTGVLGHGGNRRDEFYDEMARLLRSAASELLAEGVFDLLGPAGSQLIYFEEALHIRAGETAHANLLSLTGTLSQRVRFELLATSEPLEFSADQLAVLRSGDSAPLGLDPLLILRKDGLVDEVMFFNSLRRRDQMEYLSYTSGRMERVTVSESAVAKVIGLGEDQESPAKSFKYRFVRFGTHFVSAPGVRDNPGDEPAALHENELAVDVGNVCWGLDDETLSVLDHHFRRTDGQFPSAAAAVLHNAKRIHERFAGRDGEIWLVSHQKPDFDAFCAMYLARRSSPETYPRAAGSNLAFFKTVFSPVVRPRSTGSRRGRMISQSNDVGQSCWRRVPLASTMDGG